MSFATQLADDAKRAIKRNLEEILPNGIYFPTKMSPDDTVSGDLLVEEEWENELHNPGRWKCLCAFARRIQDKLPGPKRPCYYWWFQEEPHIEMIQGQPHIQTVIAHRRMRATVT